MTLHELGLLVQVVIWTCVCMVPLFLIWLTVAGCCVIARRRLRVRTPAQPNPVFDAFQRDGCPWCDTRECLDKTKCNCLKACGSWLCKHREASRG